MLLRRGDAVRPEPKVASFVHRGRRLSYEEHGSGERLIVYMHGLLLDADLNRGIARTLAAHGNRVVPLDLLGHGHSDRASVAWCWRCRCWSAPLRPLR